MLSEVFCSVIELVIRKDKAICGAARYNLIIILDQVIRILPRRMIFINTSDPTLPGDISYIIHHLCWFLVQITRETMYV
jgi:hypothetical protein